MSLLYYHLQNRQPSIQQTQAYNSRNVLSVHVGAFTSDVSLKRTLNDSGPAQIVFLVRLSILHFEGPVLIACESVMELILFRRFLRSWIDWCRCRTLPQRVASYILAG